VSVCIALCNSADLPNYGGALGDNAPTPSEHFENRFALDTDQNYWLFWTANTDTKTIVFEAHVKTHGYIGFGISPNGKMYPSDVVVGWVKDGQAYLKDYHTTAHSHPVVDQSQDWTLISGSENNQWTVLKFQRKLDTCDQDDLPIGEDTVRVIYSYNDNDPSSYTTISYHGSMHRGAQSLMMLSTSLDEEDVHMPNDLIHFDMLNQNFHVPSKSTTYRCRTFRLPHLSQKHHMIKFSPIVTKGYELNVHHILVYSCPASKVVDQSLDNIAYDCNHARPDGIDDCSIVTIAWAIGGTDYYYPEVAGVSLGTDKDPSFFIMETHYDNPNMRSDIVDNSGLRVFLTPTLRKYDAGLMQLGMAVNRLQVIPPQEKNFLSKGFCLEEHLRQALPVDGINVFGTVQHAHLLGAAIKTKHYRNGVEIEPISDDEHYDFNYQNVRSLRPMKKVMRGDSLEVVCHLDSTTRNRLTYGGLSTAEEMCLTFVMYYPRVPLEYCCSSPKYEAINSHPFTAVEQISSWNWDDQASHQKLKSLLDSTLHFHSALFNDRPVGDQYTTIIRREATHLSHYQKPNTCSPVNQTSHHVPVVTSANTHQQSNTDPHVPFIPFFPGKK